jgi:methionyl-tRNA formyltransferase
MKSLLVTSQVTFVPNNYDDLVVGLAGSPQIGGLLILKNNSWKLFRTSLGLIALGAHGIGRSLLRNQFPASMRRRHAAYRSQGKPVWSLPSINDEAAVELVGNNGFDLVINARTRDIYRPAILNVPPMGCINIHHGILPAQRGTMCDLWALYEREPAGFSVHRMENKIDAGEILHTEAVSTSSERDYLAYLQRSAKRECVVMQKLLMSIEADNSITGQPNQALKNIVHRKNPTRKQIASLRKEGMRI